MDTAAPPVIESEVGDNKVTAASHADADLQAGHSIYSPIEIGDGDLGHSLSAAIKIEDDGEGNTISLPIKIEDDDGEEIRPAAASSPRTNSTSQASRKRKRSREDRSSIETSDLHDAKVKEESPRLADVPKFPKGRKSLWNGIPPYGTSRPGPSQTDNNARSDGESSDDENESDWDLEISDDGGIETPSASPKQKKSRGKPAKTAREWFARHYERKVRFQKKRNQRTFAKDGAGAKISNFMNHDPVAARLETANEEPISSASASSNESHFDKLLGNTRTDGRIYKCRGDKTALKVAGESFGRAKAKRLNDNKWSLKGLKTGESLLSRNDYCYLLTGCTEIYHYQLLGSSWMLGREFDPEGPPGGLNCDVMGLGKTVEMLATIAGNPRPKDSELGPTLIVCPSNIATQWYSEIKRHVDKNFMKKVLLFKKDPGLDKEIILDCDIVVTTYYQLFNSCPWPSAEWLQELADKLKETEKRRDEQMAIEDWIEKNREDFGGKLHNIKWYRHLIKNYEAKTSYAANALQGTYRWALTATPMMNRRSELYPYYRYLQNPGISTFADFKRRFCDHKDDECNSNLDELLSRTVIRRTMQDRILGKEIMKLPTPHRKDVPVRFKSAATILYKAVEKKFQELIVAETKYEDDDPLRLMGYVIVMLTRLRQAVASLVCIELQMKVMFKIDELEKIREDLQGSDPAFEKRIDLWIKDLQHGRENPKTYKLTDEDACEICDGDLDSPMQSRICKHLYCHDCIESYATEKVGEGSDVLNCPARGCEKTLNYDRLVEAKKTSKQFTLSIKKGKDVFRFLPKLAARSEWLEDFDKGTATLPHSAKIEAIRKQVRAWRRVAPTEKIIIFVQWRLMMVLIGIMLEEEKESFLYFSGDMKEHHRADALEAFKTNPEINILIIGLKVGGVGLNLMFANRAINVDLWWNSAVESQANGRIFRIGQKLETFFARTLVRRTVDIRLLRMQIVKNAIIDTTLEKGSLSKKDVLSFLGRAIEDENGKVIGFEDDSDELDAWLDQYLASLHQEEPET